MSQVKVVLDAFVQELTKAGYVAHEAERIAGYLEGVLKSAVTEVKAEAEKLETEVVDAVKKVLPGKKAAPSTANTANT